VEGAGEPQGKPQPKTRKPKAAKVKWSTACAETYAAGISAGQGGAPCRPDTKQINGLFWSIVNTHATNSAGEVLRDEALLAWLRTTAEEFRRSRHTSYEVQNLAIKDLGKWLDGGRKTTLSRAEAARQDGPSEQERRERQARADARRAQERAALSPAQLRAEAEVLEHL
jgi:hypothetical protein